MLLSLCLTLKLQIIVFNITIKNIGDAAFLKIIPWRTKTLVWLLSWLYHWMASADFYLLQEGRWIHLLHFFPRLLLTIISFLWWKVCYTFICRTFLQVTLNFAADTFMFYVFRQWYLHHDSYLANDDCKRLLILRCAQFQRCQSMGKKTRVLELRMYANHRVAKRLHWETRIVFSTYRAYCIFLVLYNSINDSFPFPL